MSTATSTRESAALESGFVERVQASGAESHPEVTGAGTDDMSPLARRIAYLTLLAGVLFLTVVAGYVWYGSYLWQRVP
jgi:hypothetical protein